MSRIFSAKNKYTNWRKLWIALAKGEKALGLPIEQKQIDVLEEQLHSLDLALVSEYEKKLRHDVMAHLYAFAKAAPEAKGILHLGATSAYVTDNTDTILMKEALELLQGKLIVLLSTIAEKSKKYANLPTLGYTHLQPAQQTTVGKRFCLWLQDFLWDTQDLVQQKENLHFLGLKGATGTQASFLALFDQNSKKVEELDQLVAKEMGFQHLFIISGQVYSRKQDMRVFSVLEGFAASSHKCATDLRLLAHFKEVLERREKEQVGSSAMPHKRNPIFSERVCSLARFLISLCQNGTYTHATQWLERSLDDSANRKLSLPEAFLTADALLNLLIQIFSSLEIDQQKIQENLNQYLPYLALENILMLAVKKGEDRQEIHEKLRVDPSKGRMIAEQLAFTPEEIEFCFSLQTGRAKEQVESFLEKEVDPFLKKSKKIKINISKVEV